MQSTFENRKLISSVRGWLLGFAIALFLSGATALPLSNELSVLTRWFPAVGWLQQVDRALADMQHRYPFLAYGTDWLAFAHFILAILFIGAIRNPVRNKWIIEFGMLSCLLVIPFALLMGSIRGIPFWWRLVDCSFGILGLIPLGIVWQRIRKMELPTKKNIWS